MFEEPLHNRNESESEPGRETGVSGDWQRYCLDQSPAQGDQGQNDQESSGNFSLPDRQRTLKRLRDLTRLSDALLMVLGVQGSGKTHLLEQYMLQPQDGANTYQLQATPELTASDVLASMSKQLGAPQIIVASDPFEKQTNAFFELLQCQEGQLLLLVDDAHLFSGQTLSELRCFAERQKDLERRLYIVLLGEPELESRFDQLQSKELLQFHVKSLRLNPLTFEETKQYVQYRLNLLGRTGTVSLSRSTMMRIYKLSGGMPGRINRVAQQALLDSTKSRDIIMSNPKQVVALQSIVRSFMQAHRVKVISGVLMLVLIWILWSLHGSFTKLTSHSVQRSKPSVTQQNLTLAQNATVRNAATQNPTTQNPAAQNPTGPTPTATTSTSPADTNGATTPPVQPQAQTQAQQQAQPLAQAQPQPQPQPEAQSQPRPQSPIQATTPQGDQQTPGQPSPSQVKQTPLTSAQKAATKPGATPTTPAPAARRAAATPTPTATAQPSPQPAPTPKVMPMATNAQPPQTAAQKKPGASSHAYSTMEKHLLGMQGYTIQLVGVRHPDKLIQLVGSLKHQDQVSYFQSQLQNKPWYVLLYGDFKTHQQASAAIKTLPPKLRALNPWVRSLNSVHKSITRTV